MVQAADAETTLRQAEAAAARLETLVEQGLLAGYDSISRWVPSQQTQQQRLAVLPDAPTYGELGHAANNDPSWFGLVAPAGTPAAAVDRIQQAVAQALQEPDVRERLARQGLYPSGTTPKAFTTQIAREIDKMKGVAAFAKVSLD